MTDDGGGGFLAGFVLGGLVGVGIGLLLAPQPGEEVRERLREKGLELRDRADEMRSEIAQRVGDVTKDREALVREAVAKGKEAASKASAEVTARLQKERGESVPETTG